MLAETVASPDSAEAQQNLAHFLSQNLDHCHWAGRLAWPSLAGEGADNAKFTHQHNTGPISSTSILSPLKHSLLLTKTKISDSIDNLKYDPRRCS